MRKRKKSFKKCQWWGLNAESFKNRFETSSILMWQNISIKTEIKIARKIYIKWMRAICISVWYDGGQKPITWCYFENENENETLTQFTLKIKTKP